MKKIVTNSIIFCLFHIFSIILLADDVSGNMLNRHSFIIWETKSGPQLAAEMLIGKYPEDTLSSNLITNDKNKDLADISSPEQLIIKEFNLTLTADKEAILDLYYDEDAKKYADKVFPDIYETQKWHKKIKDIKFQTKSMYGDLIRIRYKLLDKDPNAFSMPWSSLCKKFNGKFYFMGYDTIKNSNIELFAIVSEMYPYWDEKLCHVEKGKFSNMKKAIFSPAENYSKTESSDLIIYYSLKDFTKQEKLKNEVLQLLKKVQSGYINDDHEAILSTAHPEIRSRMKMNLEGNPYAYKQSKASFTDLQSFTMNYYIGDSDDLFVFTQRELKDGTIDKTLKLFMFQRYKGNLYLTDTPTEMSVLHILNNTQMSKEIYQKVAILTP